jgi:hypothetical protein
MSDDLESRHLTRRSRRSKQRIHRISPRNSRARVSMTRSPQPEHVTESWMQACLGTCRSTSSTKRTAGVELSGQRIPPPNQSPPASARPAVGEGSWGAARPLPGQRPGLRDRPPPNRRRSTRTQRPITTSRLAENSPNSVIRAKATSSNPAISRCTVLNSKVGRRRGHEFGFRWAMIHSSVVPWPPRRPRWPN